MGAATVVEGRRGLDIQPHGPAVARTGAHHPPRTHGAQPLGRPGAGGGDRGAGVLDPRPHPPRVRDEVSPVGFFGELYLRSTLPFLSAEVTAREVACLARLFRSFGTWAGG